MKFRIVRMSERYLRSYHAALDRVARERKYFSLLAAPPLPVLREFVRGIVKARDLQFVALAGGEVIGWGDIIRARHETMRHGGALAIGVVPDHRGQGIGLALMERRVAAAWKCGLTRIELFVRTDNRPAIALYRRLGFRNEGRRRNAVRIDGRYFDMMAMALLREER